MSATPLYHVSTERLEQRLVELAAARARLDAEIDHVAARLAARGRAPHPSRPLVLPSADELLTRAGDVETYRQGMRP